MWVIKRNARRPFRCRIVPGTTRQHANASPLPCREQRPASRPAVYLDHTPPLRRFEHLAYLGQAPGTNPAAIEVPALALSVTMRVTSLSRCYPAGPWKYAQLSRAEHRLHQI